MVDNAADKLFELTIGQEAIEEALKEFGPESPMEKVANEQSQKGLFNFNYDVSKISNNAVLYIIRSLRQQGYYVNRTLVFDRYVDNLYVDWGVRNEG